MTSVREINDPAELESLRLTWNVLLSQTAGASYFQSLDWLQTYWRHFGFSSAFTRPGRRLVRSPDRHPSLGGALGAALAHSAF